MLKRMLWQYPMILAFLIGIVAANIWSIYQNASAVQEATEVAAPVSNEITEIDATENTVSSVESTTEEIEKFQDVDTSYFDDALFIGDSRSEGLALYGSLTNADYFTSIGLSIYKVDEIEAGNPNTSESITLQEKLKKNEYGKIYMMLGLNELGTGTTDTWVQTYADVIEEIQNAQPDAIIYIQSILPVSAAKDDPSSIYNNDAIQNRNHALQKLENPDKQVYYIDVSEAVSDENGCLESEYTSDGIHLLGNSLSLWEDYLKQHAIALRDEKTPADSKNTQEPTNVDHTEENTQLRETGTTGQS